MVKIRSSLSLLTFDSVIFAFIKSYSLESETLSISSTTLVTLFKEYLSLTNLLISSLTSIKLFSS